MMDDASFRHLAEATLAGLAALGAWVWRIARIDQQREDRLKRLERWSEEHKAENQTLLATLHSLEQSQAVQTESLRNISRSLDELRKDQREVISARLARWNDPPGGSP